MTQKKKDLLLKDLCSRLPYKPRVRYYYHSIGSSAINGYSDEGYLSYQKLEDFSLHPKSGIEKARVYNISPYLRPMGSMTEEEKGELWFLLSEGRTNIEVNSNGQLTTRDNIELGFNYPFVCPQGSSLYVDWLNEHHFDYRGLIPMGLALEAPEGMYN